MRARETNNARGDVRNIRATPSADDQGEALEFAGLSFMFRPLRDDDPGPSYGVAEAVAGSTYGFFQIGHNRPLLECRSIPIPGALTCGSGTTTAFYNAGLNRFSFSNSTTWMFDLDGTADMFLVRGTCTRL